MQKTEIITGFIIFLTLTMIISPVYGLITNSNSTSTTITGVLELITKQEIPTYEIPEKVISAEEQAEIERQQELEQERAKRMEELKIIWKIYMQEFEKAMKETKATWTPEMFSEILYIASESVKYPGIRPNIILESLPSEKEAPEGTILTKEFVEKSIEILTPKQTYEEQQYAEQQQKQQQKQNKSLELLNERQKEKELEQKEQKKNAEIELERLLK